MPKGVYPHTHLTPKVYPAEMVATVTEMYAANSTQFEIAEAIGVTQRVIYRLMRNHGIKARPAAKRDQSGPANNSWRGESAGYKALHLRVSEQRGKPSLCAWCGQTEGRFEWANISGVYGDVSDYERLCCSCHHSYDASRRRATGCRTMPIGGGAR